MSVNGCMERDASRAWAGIHARRLSAAACSALVLLWVAALSAQETPPPAPPPAAADANPGDAPPAAQAVSPGAIRQVPVRLAASCINGSIELAAMHGHIDASQIKTLALADTPITIFATATSGEREQIAAVTDAEGRLDADLGPRYAGDEILLLAQASDAMYFSRELLAGGEVPATVRFFRISSDRRLLEQQVTRVVTVQSEKPNGSLLVHVRQIVQVQVRGFEVFFGKHDGSMDVSYVFSVPRGASVTDLKVNNEDQVRRDPKEFGSWSFGIGIKEPIYPRRGLQIMGTYVIEAEAASTLDLGLHADVDTAQFVLAVERERMHYADAEEKSAQLRPAGTLSREQGVPREMLSYEAREIASGATISAPIVLSKEPISRRTLWVTFVIVMAIAIPIALALVLAALRRRRNLPAAGGAASALAAGALEMRLARGEIGVEEFERLRGAVAARPSAAAALQAIAARKGATPAEVAEDVRRLAAIVRDELVRGGK